MTITRVGSNQKYSVGWDAIFGGSTKVAGVKKAKPKKTKGAKSASKRAPAAPKADRSVSAKKANKVVKPVATKKVVVKKAAPRKKSKR
ncbi:MAG: hypothetical protein ACKN81_07100 [Pirellulaceae bacterium]